MAYFLVAFFSIIIVIIIIVTGQEASVSCVERVFFCVPADSKDAMLVHRQSG